MYVKKTSKNRLTCPRCQGLLVRTFIDRVDCSEFHSPGKLQFQERCLNCGERLDLAILENRRKPRKIVVRNMWGATTKVPINIGPSQ